MAITGKLDLSIWRNDDVYELPLLVRGLDLTTVSLGMDIRLYGDAPGAPLVRLSKVTAANAEGLRVAGVTVVDGVPTSDLRIRLNRSTRQGLPYSGEIGDAASFAYALAIAGRTRLIGALTLPAHAYASDGAPTERSAGWSNGGSSLPMGGAVLTVAGQDVVSVSLDGTDLVAGVAEKAQDALARIEDFTKGDKGDPGGASDLVGTRVQAMTMVISAGYQMIRTTGFEAVGQGGAYYARVSNADIDAAGYPALAYFRSADRFMPDGSTSASLGGYWLVQPGPQGYDVTAFGAVIDRSSDALVDGSGAATAAVQMARAFRQGVYCPPGIALYLASAVDFTGLRLIRMDVQIRVSPSIAGVPVQFGGLGNSGNDAKYLFSDVIDGSSTGGPPPARPLIRAIGVKGADVTIGSSGYIQLYADMAQGTDYGSTANNLFHFNGEVGLCELTDSGAPGGYVNENTIIGSRIVRIRIIGKGYSHNHNEFIRCSLEAGGPDPTFQSQAYFKKCHSNHLGGTRAESFPDGGLVFEADTSANSMELSWANAGVEDNFRVPFDYTDLGQGNIVTTRQATLTDKVRLAVVKPDNFLATATDTCGYDRTVAPNAIAPFSRAVLDPGFDTFGFRANELILASAKIPVVPGRVIVPDTDFDGSTIRPLIWVYGADGKPLLSEGSGGPYVQFINQGPFNTTYGVYGTAGDLSSAEVNRGAVAIMRPECAFVVVGFYSGSGGRARLLAWNIYVRKLMDGKIEAAGTIAPAMPILDGPPAKGYAPARTLIYDSAAGVIRRSTLAYEAAVASAVSAGATSVTVSNAGSIANGDPVGIVLDNGVTHWTKVSALSGATFAIDAVPAGRSVPAGARAVFNRWS